MTTKLAFKLGLVFFTLVALAFISLSVGAANIDLWSGLNSLFNRDPELEAQNFVFWQLRLPRTLSCISIGLSLGLSGALLQTLLKNPLAEPYTLGVSGGATLGAILAILFRIQPSWLLVPFFSFLGSLVATSLIFVLVKRNPLSSQRTMILAGIMISLFCGSIVILLMTLLDPFQIQSSIAWMVGQVGTERA